MVAAALCAFPAQVLASPPPPYAVAGLGYSMIGLETADLAEQGLQTSGSDRHAIGYAIALGWRFTSYLAVEAAFLDLGEGRFDVADQDGGPVSNARIGVRSNGGLFSLAGTWPIHERLSLEGRAGVFLGRTETRVSGVGSGQFGNQALSYLVDTDSTAGLAAGIGAVVAFNDTWALRAGYDYLDAAFGKNAGRISLGVRFNWP